jgi:hypothetical protein
MLGPSSLANSPGSSLGDDGSIGGRRNDSIASGVLKSGRSDWGFASVTGKAQNMPENLEPGTLAYSKYELFLPNTSAASIAVTLQDMTHDSAASQFARSRGATCCGLILIQNMPGAPKRPMVWSLRDAVIVITTSADDCELSDELKRVIVRLLGVFFHETRDVAPELCALTSTVANDSVLN